MIYELYETVVAALENDLDKEEQLTEKGIAEVKAVFNGRDGKVAGSEILEGTFLGPTRSDALTILDIGFGPGKTSPTSPYVLRPKLPLITDLHGRGWF